MSHLLALDQGTTSSRAMLFDSSGRLVAQAQREFRQIFPQQGWVEHDPEEIWSSQLAVARAALDEARLGANDVAAIGIANQRETALVWERASGRPVCNAIVWQDRRTAAACERLRAAGHEPTIAAKTGLLLDPYFSATKLSWILENVPDARVRAERGELAFGTVDSWLVWRLTGGAAHITDATNASRTLLFDIRSCDWDDELLRLFEIPRALMPAVASSSGLVAMSAAECFGAPIAIAGIAGDQQAALIGQRCTAPGMVKNTYGTGCFMLMQTGATPITSRHRLVTTIAAKTDAATHYALEGSVFVAGSIVQWLRDGLGIIGSSSEVESLAATVPDNGGVFLVPALAGLGAPHWDPRARGAIFGLTRGASKAHIARAALESIAFQSADLIGAMQADSGIRPSEMRVDGGAARNDLLMQFQADLLGVPVVRPAFTETTALGAAFLAGLGIGVWRNEAELDRQWRRERVFEPTMPAERVAQLKSNWRRALERVARWTVDD